MSIWVSTLVGWWHLHFLSAVGLLDIYIFSFIEVMIIISSEFLQSLNSTTNSLNSRAFMFTHYTKKWSFSWRVSSVNVNKSSVSLMENFIFVQWLYCRNCETISSLTCWWLSCTIYLFHYSFTIVSNHSLPITENENQYDDLRPRSQRKDEHFSKTFFLLYIIIFNTMKLLVKTFKIKLFSWINVFKKV